MHGPDASGALSGAGAGVVVTVTVAGAAGGAGAAGSSARPNSRRAEQPPAKGSVISFMSNSCMETRVAPILSRS